MDRKAFLMVKRQQGRALDLADGQCYLLDRVRLSINRKGEVVLSTTSKTVVR